MELREPFDARSRRQLFMLHNIVSIIIFVSRARTSAYVTFYQYLYAHNKHLKHHYNYVLTVHFRSCRFWFDLNIHVQVLTLHHVILQYFTGIFSFFFITTNKSSFLPNSLTDEELNHKTF